jgi:hypothetical protein
MGRKRSNLHSINYRFPYNTLYLLTHEALARFRLTDTLETGRRAEVAPLEGCVFDPVQQIRQGTDLVLNKSVSQRIIISTSTPACLLATAATREAKV